MTFEELPDILTVRQIARFMKLGDAVVYRMIRERRLPAMKFGRAIRISKKAFAAVLERGELKDAEADDPRPRWAKRLA